ncbi:hypothetical protein GGTG_06088 [Gaeumannomyces tritici R3-111a-1]|uniref:Uncharacterized protein n=1 Tax=Gaeumannomyces tritici (strain R3-111a-1) TaxID=644352 RepID=J3NXT3_GAET3|nr:hypothetical protein GGTG_06088 [Gaeumannomyces tritici R3-111a-1]EJT76166.1 hypothetical protein GGTG_06088 [Gaeumannomyces tritici R3-111a-1]
MRIRCRAECEENRQQEPDGGDRKSPLGAFHARAIRDHRGPLFLGMVGGSRAPGRWGLAPQLLAHEEGLVRGAVLLFSVVGS